MKSRRGTPWSRCILLVPSAVLVFALVFVLTGCDDFVLASLLDGEASLRAGGDLAIAPAAMTVAANTGILFSAAGGEPPYTFAVVSGTGTINSTSGAYTAPAVPGTDQVRVTDADGDTDTATVTITASGALQITPSAVTLAVNNSLTFMASGGVPPYTFSLTATGSGTPSVNAATGQYTTGGSAGGDTVQVEDSDSPPATAAASVTVTTVVTNVDYDVVALDFPASGMAGTAVPGGSDFTIQNVGSADGGQTVSWKIYLSSNTTLDTGDSLFSSGTNAALASGGTAVIPLTGTWPLSGGSYYLIVELSATDDLTTGNNTESSAVINVTEPDVDYTVTAVNNTGGTVAGGAIAGDFTCANGGADGGTQPVAWEVYVSGDTTIGVGDTLIDSGTIGALGAGAGSGAIGFTGTWPQSAGTYYLIATATAADDVNTANDDTASAAIAVTQPDVDYTVTAVNSTGGTVAGGPLAGDFTVQNAGADAGSVAVSWTAYVSTDAVLGSGDTVVDSGTTAALGAGAGSGAVAFGGTWPGAVGTYYLIVEVAATDDGNGANDEGASAGVAVSGPDVDYTVTAVSNTGSTEANDGFISGNFDIANIGSSDGTEQVSWKVYRSDDASLDGGDVILHSGTTGPLLSGGSVNIPFGGTALWPSVAGTYHLIAEVIASDDGTPGNETDNLAVTVTYVNGGTFAEIIPDNNGDTTNFVNVDDTGFVLKPGREYQVTGQVDGGGGDDDVFRFDTGTASEVEFVLTWGSGDLFDLVLYSPDYGNPIALSDETTSGSETLVWSVDAPSVDRYIDVWKWGPGGNGTPYTLTIRAH